MCYLCSSRIKTLLQYSTCILSCKIIQKNESEIKSYGNKFCVFFHHHRTLLMQINTNSSNNPDWTPQITFSGPSTPLSSNKPGAFEHRFYIPVAGAVARGGGGGLRVREEGVEKYSESRLEKISDLPK